MVLNKRTTRAFHRRLYASEMETITLLKRNDDQLAGTVVAYVLFDCRRGQITKMGEPIQGEMSVDHRATWHIPRIELDRVGVNYINALDRIVDNQGRYWQPEADQLVLVKLFENRLTIDMVRVDPPKKGA